MPVPVIPSHPVLRNLAGLAILAITAVAILGCPRSAHAQAAAPAELAERLSSAIRFETIAEAGNSDASLEAFMDFRTWLAETFPLVHERMEPQTVAGGSLWYTLAGSDPELRPIVLLAHQDVVPVEDGTAADWTHPPFAGVVADGYVWGRGALDMKGPLVMAMSAMESLLADGFTPVRTVHIGLGHDEEVGGGGAQAMAALLGEANTRAWFVLDEGGTYLRAFPSTGRPAALIGVAEKGIVNVEVTASARGGHSSSPPRDTAIGLLARAMTAISDNPFDLRIDPPVDAMLRALSADMSGVSRFVASYPGVFAPLLRRELANDDTSRALLGTTIAPTILEGGSVANVLPQHARAVINLRIHPRDTAQSVLEHLRRAVGDLEGVSVEILGEPSEPAAVSPTDGPAWRIIADAAARQAPQGTPIVPYMLSAGTDSRHFAGVADMIYRYSPMDMEITDMERIHGTDERIGVEALPLMVSFYREVIAQAGAYAQD